MSLATESVRAQDISTSEAAQAVDRALRQLRVQAGPYSVARDYTFKDTDTIDSLQVNATASALTITLPSPTGNRRRRIIKTDASANTVTISGGGNLINGVASHILSVRYGNITVEPTGTSWLIVGWNTQVLISGGTIDGTPIGQSVPANGSFVALDSNYLIRQISNGITTVLGNNGGQGMLGTNSAHDVVIIRNAAVVGTFTAASLILVGTLQTGVPTVGASGAWKLGKYTAGVAAQAGKVRVNIDGTDYDLLTA